MNAPPLLRVFALLGLLLVAALPSSTLSGRPPSRAIGKVSERAATLSGAQTSGPSLYQQGRQALIQGDTDAAERLWRRGQEQAKEAGDRSEEAKCSFMLGYLADELHAFDRAVVCYSGALALWEQIGDPKEVAATEENLSLSYYTLGQIDSAWNLLHDALALRQRLQDAGYVAVDRYRIGAIYYELGQPDQAIESWRRAQTAFMKQGNQNLSAQCLNNLGLIYRETDQLKAALDALQSAAAIRQKIGSALDYADTLNNLGQVYDDLGRPDQALPHYRQALQLFEASGQKLDITSGSSSLAQDLGALYLRLGQEEKAESAFQEALKQEEALRAQIADPGEISDLQAALPNAYAGLAALRLRQHRAPEALELAERGRVQGLARQAMLCRAQFSGLLADADRTRLQSARLAVSETDRLQRVAEQLPASPAAETQRTQARDRFHQAQADLTQLQAELCRRVPDYGRVQGMSPPSLPQLQALADRNPDTLYLEWTLVEPGTTLLFALSHSGGLRAFTLPVGSRELARRTRQWREALTAPGETRLDRQTQAQRLAATEPTLARSLSHLLFGPLEKAGLMPSGKSGSPKRLVIVADGPLLDIPFAALTDGSGNRLITRAALSTSPSIGMLDWPVVSSSGSTTLLCVADPTGKGGQALRTGSRGNFGALPYARKEGEAVARLFPHALALFGPEARKERVAQEIGSYTLLHFATHGVLDTRVGLRSGLALAPEKAGSTEAAILDARDILGLKLSANLAVLSACESGLGQRTGGEGLKGLCWAFRAAGCPSIVASQWKVDDVATRDLMIAFYTGLKAGRRKDDALRDAMLRVAAVPNRTHPFYWAAFQVMGDTLPLPAAP